MSRQRDRDIAIAHSIGLGLPGIPVPRPSAPAPSALGLKLVVIKTGEISARWRASRGGLSGTGRTPDEAIGDLVRCHPAVFGLPDARTWDWPEAAPPEGWP